MQLFHELPVIILYLAALVCAVIGGWKKIRPVLVPVSLGLWILGTWAGLLAGIPIKEILIDALVMLTLSSWLCRRQKGGGHEL